MVGIVYLAGSAKAMLATNGDVGAAEAAVDSTAGTLKTRSTTKVIGSKGSGVFNFDF